MIIITDQKYSCTTEFGAEFLLYIAVLFTFIFGLLSQLYPDASLLLSAAYAMLLQLMSYMFSVAKQYNPEGIRAHLILIWMVLVEIIHIDGVPILSGGLWNLAEQLVRLIWVGFLVFTYAPILGIRTSLLVLCLYCFVAAVAKGLAVYIGTKSYLIGKNPKLIHNYVKRIMLEDDLRTTPMNSCDYIVMGEQNHEIDDSINGYSLGKKKSNSEGILTIGRVFQLNLPAAVADTCISLALAKMLRRRFAKFPVDEAGCRKALDFVLEGLIDDIGGYRDIQTDSNDGERKKMERVFRIIKEELGLVCDFLHVRVPTYYYYPWYAIIVFFGILLVFIDGIYFIYTIIKRRHAWLSFWRIQVYNCFFHIYRRADLVNLFFECDLVITIYLVFIGNLIVLPGLVKLVRSHSWFNLRFLERYLKNPANWNRSSYSSEAPSEKELPKTQGKNAKKAREYFSVLEVSTLGRLPKWIRRIINVFANQKFPVVFVGTDAKEAILRFLRESGGQLTNGETSLKKYGMNHLNRALCQSNGSNTEAILVWHIATTLLHCQEPSQQQNNDPNQEPAPQQNNNPFTKEVALSLSNYCHYLVSELPELLPDDVKWTEKMYGNVMKDILDISWQSSDRCKYALQTTWHESSVVGKGVKLAKDLIHCGEEGAQVWMMLAHFWAEMMLFIAPSDNVEGHEKILSREELITQLWALLTNRVAYKHELDKSSHAQEPLVS